ncbi:hypothetical protein BEWA_052030 [Theileria equi strain WA]|uniref:PNPLA domain-containing protein n=1 Tax=Theileria equi strain WA TaxID=1537102 RepID=L1LCY8_THEEQ|nr:hypothetical protein BEWA_052030 [Theileria equi strain WA]EKX73149.1 hypothetical protein BEWA_052030 [Theileria equi strain WA]|eukprot:XP_004832601.1 hypothetical protein BEWA_052030 [Theileria equi strain WA]
MLSYRQNKSLLLLSATQATKRNRKIHYIGCFIREPRILTTNRPKSFGSISYESARSYHSEVREGPELHRNLETNRHQHDLHRPLVDANDKDNAIITHVQRAILECLRDKSAKNRISALSSLHSFSSLSTSINDVLLENDVLSSLLEILERPYQKSIWTLMNSYVWPKNPIKAEENLIVQEKVLGLLISMALNSKNAKETMKNDIVLKRTLLKIYFYYSPEAIDKGNEKCTSGNFESTIDKNSRVLTNSNGGNDSERIRAFIKELFITLGYQVNEDISLLPSNLIDDNNETKDWTWDKIIPFSSTDGDSKIHIEDLLIPITSNLKQKQSKSTDNYSSHTISWVPYYCKNVSSGITTSIKRYIRINLGCIDEQLSNFKNINAITISSTSGYDTNEDVLGVLALHRIESNVIRYSLISNIRLKPSEDLNRNLIILDLLSSIGSFRDFKILNDIFTELWVLLGSESTDITDIISTNLNLNAITDIINATALVSALPVSEENTAFGIREIRKYSDIWKYLPWRVGLLEIFKSYLKSFVNPTESGSFAGVFDLLGKIGRKLSAADNVLHVSDEVLVNSADIRPDYSSPKNTMEQAKKLQTTLFGFLVELIYLGGDKNFLRLRDDERLIAAIKSVKSQHPKCFKLQEIFADKLSEFEPIIDKRKSYRVFKTNVIGEFSSNSKNNYNIEDSYYGKEPDLNELGDFRLTSWKRYGFCNKQNVGPIYNSNKLLNLLGHHDTNKFKKRGIRILSIDGGGSKGVVALEILSKIFLEIGKPIHEIFDLVCGTSTGGIVAALIALEQVEISNIQKLYDLLISRIFVKDSYHVSGARLLMRHALYDECAFVNLLKTLLGDLELIDYSVDDSCPKFFCLSTQLDTSPLKPVIWRNYNYHPESYTSDYTRMLAKEGSCVIKLADALRATTAAPGYFPAFERNGHIYGDGALHSNNPSLIAYMEAKMIYPNTPIDCLVSVGNGNVTDFTINKNEDNISSLIDKEVPSDLPQSQIQTLKEVFGTFMDHGIVRNCGLKDVASGAPKQLGIEQIISQVISAATNTEIVHSALDNLMEPNKYFRFNPIIPSVRIDETSQKVLDYLKALARNYLREKKTNERMEILKQILML